MSFYQFLKVSSQLPLSPKFNCIFQLSASVAFGHLFFLTMFYNIPHMKDIILYVSLLSDFLFIYVFRGGGSQAKCRQFKEFLANQARLQCEVQESSAAQIIWSQGLPQPPINARGPPEMYPAMLLVRGSSTYRTYAKMCALIPDISLIAGSLILTVFAGLFEFSTHIIMPLSATKYLFSILIFFYFLLSHV